MLRTLKDWNVRSYCPEPDRGRRRWSDKEADKAAVYGNRRRIRGDRGKRLLRQRGKKGGAEFRLHVRNRNDEADASAATPEHLKRLLIHAAAFNFGLLMRGIAGGGTPRELGERAQALLITLDLLNSSSLDRTSMTLWRKSSGRRNLGRFGNAMFYFPSPSVIQLSPGLLEIPALKIPAISADTCCVSISHMTPRRSSIAQTIGQRTERLQIWNITRGTLLGNAVSTAKTSTERNTGLLRHSSLHPGEGLWIETCAVHTFFMNFPLDLVYVDRNSVIRKAVRHLKPWRISVCASARAVIEFPTGTIQRTFTECGDRLRLQSVPVFRRDNRTFHDIG